MKFFRARFVCFSVTLLGLSGCAHDDVLAVLPSPEMRAEARKKGASVKTAILQAKELELISLDPLPDDPRIPNRLAAIGMLSNYKIIGRASTTDRTEIRNLADALEAGISATVFAANCFLPRHAIRFDGPEGKVQVLVCFHCANGEMTVGEQTIGFSISGASEDAFDSVYSHHKLAKAWFPTVDEVRKLESAIAAEPAASVAKLFGTPENLAVVREGGQADACILRHIPPATRPDGSVDWKTERFEETPFTPLPAALVPTVRDLILDDKTYDWAAGGGGRRPQFYLRLRFHRGKEAVAVDFCFLCHVLSVSKQGEELAHAHLGRNGDLFLLAFLKLFPDDAPLRQAAREAGVIP